MTTEIRKAVAETLQEIMKDRDCYCGYGCNCGLNPIEEEVMDRIEKYFKSLFEKLGGNMKNISLNYDWEYKEKST